MAAAGGGGGDKGRDYPLYFFKFVICSQNFVQLNFDVCLHVSLSQWADFKLPEVNVANQNTEFRNRKNNFLQYVTYYMITVKPGNRNQRTKTMKYNIFCGRNATSIYLFLIHIYKKSYQYFFSRIN